MLESANAKAKEIKGRLLFPTIFSTGEKTRACIHNNTRYFCGGPDLFLYKQVTKKDFLDMGRRFVVRPALTSELNDVEQRIMQTTEVEKVVALDFYTQKVTAKKISYKERVSDGTDGLENLIRLFPTSKRTRDIYDRNHKTDTIKVGDILTLKNPNVHPRDYVSVRIFEGEVINIYRYIVRKGEDGIERLLPSETFGTVILRVIQDNHKLTRSICKRPAIEINKPLPTLR